MKGQAGNLVPNFCRPQGVVCDKKLYWKRKGRMKCFRTINRIRYLAPSLRMKNNLLSSLSVFVT